MLRYIYLISLLIAFFCGVACYKRLPTAYKWLTAYQLFAFCYELASTNSLLIWHNTDSWCNNLEGIVELVLFTYLLACFKELTPYKKIIYLGEGLVLIFTFIDIAFMQGFFKLDTVATVVQGVFMLLLIFVYYYLLLKDAHEDQRLIYNPDFLMATGLLLYLLGGTFFYACFSFIAYNNNPTFLIVARIIPSAVNLLFNLLILLAFLCFIKKDNFKLLTK